jgi:hypothetical protein
MEVPRYPHQGWILERWMPPHMWGTEDQWRQQKSEDGTPMMGPFPKEGDYFMICGPFPKIPEWGDMENAIANYECQQRLRPENFAAAIAQAIKDEKDLQEKKVQRFEEELEQRRKSDLLPVMKSGSLAAQRFRQTLARMAHQSGHSPIY